MLQTKYQAAESSYSVKEDFQVLPLLLNLNALPRAILDPEAAT